MTPAERDAAILRGATGALERDPAAGGPRLLDALARELVGVDPRFGALLATVGEGSRSDAEQLAAHAASALSALPAREWQALAAAARAFRDREPGERRDDAAELAARLLAVASPAASRGDGTGRRGAPDSRPRTSLGAAARLGCIALSTVAAVAILGFGFLASAFSTHGPRSRAARPQRPNAARRTEPRRNVAHPEATPGAAAPVPRTRVEREAAAIGVLRAIGAAQVLVRDLDGARDESFLYAPLAGLVAKHRLAASFAGGHRQGYVFATAPSAEAPGERFWATASPETPEPGSRWFFSNQSGVVLAASAPFAVDEDACAPGAPAPPPAPAPGHGGADAGRAFAAAGRDALYASRWFDAIEPLETALELAPEDVEAWANLGKAYLELGAGDRWTREGQLATNVLLARAEDALVHGAGGDGSPRSQARALCQNNLGLLFLAQAEDQGRLPREKEARLAARLGHVRAAAACFERALALDRDFDVARINAAAAWLGEAELASPGERAPSGARALAALEGCRALREEDPSSTAAFRNLGLAHRAAGHPVEAVRALARVLDAGAGAADERSASALREQALLLAHAPGTALSSEDRALLAHAAELLHARGRAGVRGGAADEGAATEIDAALGDAK